MTVLKIRVVPDVEDDVFRDIQIGQSCTMEELYNCIIQSFGFRGDQMASFYMSNENWDKGHEIALMDMGGPSNLELPKEMSSALVGKIISEQEQKLILVYDFLKMWCFYLEVLDITNEEDDGKPKVIMTFGDAPNEDDKEMPDLMEGIEDEKSLSDYDDEFIDEFDDEDFDSQTFENIDDLDI